MQYDLFVVVVLCAAIIILGYLITKNTINGLQRTIDSQNSTIKHLIHHEPVTYQETGQAPHTPSKEIYVAWGSQMVDLDKDA